MLSPFLRVLLRTFQDAETWFLDSVTRFFHAVSELCLVYESAPEMIASSWIAFSIKKGIHVGDMTVALLDQMEQEVLAKDNSKYSAKTPVSRKTVPRIFTANSNSINQSVKYSSRSTSGGVVAHLNNHEKPVWTCSNDLDVQVCLAYAGSVCKPDVMYMFEKMKDKAGCLWDSASDLAEYYQKEEMDEKEAFANISELILEDSFVTGRVLCDSCGKMNASSLILEGSETSNGQSVKLDVSKLKQYSLFPGQVIVGKGTNPTQKTLILKELFDKITCAPDPCLLDIGGYIVGATSVDVLMHLGREEISFSPKLSDRLSRLAKHILSQQSEWDRLLDGFESTEANVGLLFQDVDGCICVNPEHLTKGVVGGCFARVVVNPIDQEMYTGSMAAKTIVEVIRI
ncbi:hypothetical protein HPB51_015439 [Rhipicephalus microplus]|uniref:DNA polymerase alpha subunit B n=1 Tax=Rhipicephalus microplus TaxID=6941 RepID=A0A9J6DW43_RHIMP|nr:hypothetical protein HPB51_015439 [Rhipicephalus microplus]